MSNSMKRDPETGVFVGEADYTREELKEFLQRCEREYGEVTRKLLLRHYPAPRSSYEEEFGTITDAKKAADVQVNRDYISRKRRQSLQPESHRDLFTGLLMGDGWIDNRKASSASCFRIKMTNRRFLEWVSGVTGDITTTVRKVLTSAESARNARESGFRPNASRENYRPVYVLNSRRHRWFDELASWYEDGGKRFPDDLKLTPLMTKMWYVTDGGLVMTDGPGFGYPFIKTRNESSRKEFLVGLFKDIGFRPRFDEYNSNLVIRRDECGDFLEWMGEPPDGFEYKWETESYQRYQRLKEETYSDV